MILSRDIFGIILHPRLGMSRKIRVTTNIPNLCFHTRMRNVMIEQPSQRLDETFASGCRKR